MLKIKLPEHIKDFFYFSKGERNGISVLLIMILLVVILPHLYEFFVPAKNYDHKDFYEEIIAFEHGLYQDDKLTQLNTKTHQINQIYDTLKLFYFDPNITSNENFKKLGLSEKQINTINNYRDKGGKFYVKEDFLKIYGIHEDQYLKLKPYILLKGKVNQTSEKYKSSVEIEKKGTLFYFNPNHASEKDFSKLGLSEKQIKTITNYKNKGGFFYKKEDLKKIYGITNDLYQKLEPFITIDDYKKEIVEELIIVELNSANYQDLVEIKGIGDYLANSIIKYRTKLGGFIALEQLLEINNFHEKTFHTIKQQLKIDQGKITKINLNFSEVKELVNHPYLNYNEAKVIVQYRTENGPYKSINQLLDQKILSVKNFNKIRPYLTVN